MLKLFNSNNETCDFVRNSLELVEKGLHLGDLCNSSLNKNSVIIW